MTKSATDLMQEILFSAVIDAVVAMKDAARGVPNTLLRELNAIHANTTYSDLPPHVQAAITTSVRIAFNKLLKEGYAVAPAINGGPPRPRPTTPRPGGGSRPPIVETKRRPRPRPDDGKPGGKR